MANNLQNFDVSRILCIDEQCLVVNKLCGEAVEGAVSGMADLPLILGQYLNSSENNFPKPFSGSSILSAPVAVQRLDVPVTGCALFARTQEALVFLNRVFNSSEHGNGAAEKYYWAIIEKPGRDIKASANLVH